MRLFVSYRSCVKLKGIFESDIVISVARLGFSCIIWQNFVLTQSIAGELNGIYSTLLERLKDRVLILAAGEKLIIEINYIDTTQTDNEIQFQKH
jgi:hypothetical protein